LTTPLALVNLNGTLKRDCSIFYNDHPVTNGEDDDKRLLEEISLLSTSSSPGRNLASKILSLANRQVPEDWNSYYGYKPVLLETFVDIGRFIGTSYKVGNWTYLGRTQGKGRRGMNYYVHNRPKDVYVYPLQRDYIDTHAFTGVVLS